MRESTSIGKLENKKGSYPNPGILESPSDLISPRVNEISCVSSLIKLIRA